MAEKKPTETPMMKQFFAVKAEHPEALLLFRCGDFYETYGDDALTASKVLGIVLTKRSNAAPDAIPMAGFPHHSLFLLLYTDISNPQHPVCFLIDNYINMNNI